MTLLVPVLDARRDGESLPDTVPALSAIVLTRSGYDGVRRLLACLAEQTIAGQIEIIVVAPDTAALGVAPAIAARFAVLRTVSCGGQPLSTAAARAAGIRAASAPIVALTEEHSHPEPVWAEALLAAYRAGGERVAAVGAAIVNANPDSAVSWANFLLEYGPWSDPAVPGDAEHLPGHNDSYRRERLLAYGDRLETMLEAESVIHWEMRAAGLRTIMAPAARTRHWNYSDPVRWIPLRYLGGRWFAGYRAQNQGWSPGKRLTYVAASPLIPLVRLRRIVREVRRPGRLQGRSLSFLLPTLVLALVLDAAGEAAGYLLGPGQTGKQLADCEYHRRGQLSRTDREREDAP